MSTEAILTACGEMIARFTCDQLMWDETREAIIAAPEKAAESLRRRLKVGRYRHNRAECRQCNAVIESRTTHDFVTCGCGRVSVDGGTQYLRRIGQEIDFNDRSELWPWLPKMHKERT